MSFSRKEYLALVQKIALYDEHYYVRHNPLITDYEYDLLYKQLLAIEKDHPEWVESFSPSQRIQDPLEEGFVQKEHRVPMLSLANTYNPEDLEEFVERVYKLAEKREVEFWVDLKLDGVAISVCYENGRYVQALTRGDGRKGDDVTNNIQTIRSLPLVLQGENIPSFVELRGEVVMSKASFALQNEQRTQQGEEMWANPRNAAAGSLKLLDPAETKERRLSLYLYGIGYGEGLASSTQQELFLQMQKWGLPVVPKQFVKKCTNKEEVLSFAKYVEKERSLLPFAIDGIVVKVNRFSLQRDLGSTPKAPRWAVAYKFAPEQVLTKILSITVQVGRTGVLTPVAELEPVFLAGSRIARASLHNQEEVDRKQICEGDFVWVEKGGEVIPQVVKVDITRRRKGAKMWQMPDRCPCCNTRVEKEEGQVAVRCPNHRNCPAQFLARLLFFTQDSGMNIEHLGEKVAQELIEKKLVQSIPDIYILTEEDLAKLKNFKEKSIHNLLQSIEKSKKVSLAHFITALGIRHVGEETAQKLASHFTLSSLMSASLEQLKEIAGIGDKVAESLFSYFQDKESLEEIELLLQRGVCIEEKQNLLQHKHPLIVGKTIVVTGTFSQFSRGVLEEWIRKNGGKVSSAVSKKTHYLFLGKEPGSKLDKARELHTPIWEEKKILEVMQEI